MADKLKPCPFCGGRVKMVNGIIAGTIVFVCEKCGADVMFFGTEKDKDKAVKAWNRRAKRWLT